VIVIIIIIMHKNNINISRPGRKFVYTRSMPKLKTNSKIRDKEKYIFSRNLFSVIQSMRLPQSNWAEDTSWQASLLD